MVENGLEAFLCVLRGNHICKMLSAQEMRYLILEAAGKKTTLTIPQESPCQFKLVETVGHGEA